MWVFFFHSVKIPISSAKSITRLEAAKQSRPSWVIPARSWDLGLLMSQYLLGWC
jgi:hypothetical protein